MHHLVSRLARLCGIAVLFGGASAPLLHAQKDFSDREATAGLTAGAEFNGGASLIIKPPEGRKLAPVFAWRAGLTMTYPLAPVISAGLSLGLDSRGTELHYPDASEFYTISRVTYFSITPSLSFRSFYLGLNMGVPMSGSNTSRSGQLAAESSVDMTDTEFERVEFLLEPRIGAVIPLLDDENGWLGLNITAGYSLTTLFDYGEGPADIIGDYHMASLHLGVTYQLAIPGTRRK